MCMYTYVYVYVYVYVYIYFWQWGQLFLEMKTIEQYDVRLLGPAMRKQRMPVDEVHAHVLRNVVDVWHVRPQVFPRERVLHGGIEIRPVINLLPR